MRIRRISMIVLLALSLLLSATVVPAEEWTRFRGANGTGVASSKGLPTELGPDRNVEWMVEVPFGRSSPVVGGDRIYLTATDEGKFVTMAVDRKTGKVVWRQTLKPARQAEFHHDTDSATTTPVTDGENVYAFFQEYGIVSYDKEGKERWKHAMGPFDNFYSIAASPVLGGSLLYMLCDQKEGSFLLALDTATGKVAWRRERPGRLEAYTTPILYPDDRKPTALIVLGSAWIDAYEPKTGKTLWAIGEVGVGPVSSPVLDGDTIYVTAPNHAENGWPPFDPILTEFDKDGNGKLTREEVAEAWLIQHWGWLDRDADDLITRADWETLGGEVKTDHWGAYAIRLKEDGSAPDRLWNYRKNLSEIATPLVHDDLFYMVEKGVLTTLNATTGELIKRDRVGEGAAKIYASPVAADGKVFVGTLDGTMYVVSGKGEWEVLSSVDLKDEIWATPAIANDRLYVRTRGKLYSFGQAEN